MTAKWLQALMTFASRNRLYIAIFLGIIAIIWIFDRLRAISRKNKVKRIRDSLTTARGPDGQGGR